MFGVRFDATRDGTDWFALAGSSKMPDIPLHPIEGTRGEKCPKQSDPYDGLLQFWRPTLSAIRG